MNLNFIRPRNAPETVLLLVLSAAVFIAFVIFALILARILLKLYAERRQEQLGSRFKTRMVIAFLSVSLVPVFFLYLFAYGLLNRSIDRWFGVPFGILRQDANEMVSQLEQETARRAADNAEHVASSLRFRQALVAGDSTGLEKLLGRRVRRMGVESVLCFDAQSHLLARTGTPWPGAEEVAALFPDLAGARLPEAGETAQWPRGRRDLFLAARPVAGDSGRVLGSVVVIRRLPLNLREIAGQIQQEAERYDALSRERKAVKRLYLLILFLITLVILFAATWFAMFLSKQVTVPIQALAEATHEVSRGNLGWRVSTRAGDELGTLVHEFNEMTRQLDENRRALEKAARDFEGANRQLEERGNTMEAILENIPAGVISLDPAGKITEINATAERMFGLKRGEPSPSLSALLSPEEAREVARLLRRAARQGVVTRQMQMRLKGEWTQVGLTLSSVSAQHGAVGFVLVLEDLTEVVRAQRSAAWREVAQRIAHEIKNPLTPIQLSAERLRRLIDHSSPPPAPDRMASVVAQSASLIGREVATLKTLVDEFSALARFPVSRPIPSSLNGIIEEGLNVFEGRLSNIRIHRDLAPDLPPVLADPEQMKRVIVNLIDNAAEVLDHWPAKEIWVRTAVDADRDLVALVVADSGPGIPAEAKERLFLPYFSTKQRGTGLGLAIVSRIVSEHNGAIRVEENRPTGTRFVIELPVESVAVTRAEG